MDENSFGSILFDIAHVIFIRCYLKTAMKIMQENECLLFVRIWTNETKANRNQAKKKEEKTMRRRNININVYCVCCCAYLYMTSFECQIIVVFSYCLNFFFPRFSLRYWSTKSVIFESLLLYLFTDIRLTLSTTFNLKCHWLNALKRLPICVFIFVHSDRIIEWQKWMFSWTQHKKKYYFPFISTKSNG